MKSLSMSTRYTYVLLLLGSLMTFGFQSSTEAADKPPKPAAAKPSNLPATTAAATAVAAPAPAAPVAATYSGQRSREGDMVEACGKAEYRKKVKDKVTGTERDETPAECLERLMKGPTDTADAQCTAAIKDANDAYTKVRAACGGVDAGMNLKKCIDYNKDCKDRDEGSEMSTSQAMGEQLSQSLGTAIGNPAMTTMNLPQSSSSTDPDEKPCPKMTYEKWQDGFKSINTSLDEANRELAKLNVDYGKIDTDREKETNRTTIEMNRMERDFDEKNKAADADIRENIRKGVQGFNNINSEIRGLEEKIRNDQNVLVFIYQEKALLLSQGSKAIMNFQCNKQLKETLKDLPSIKSGGLKNLVKRTGNINTVKQDAVNECILALKAGRESKIKESEMKIETAKANIKNNEARLAELRQELQLNQSHFEQAKAAAEDSKNKNAAQQAKEMMAKSQENMNLLKEAQAKKQGLQTQMQQQQKIINRQSNMIAGLGAKPDADTTETGKTAQKAVGEWISKLSYVKQVSEECCNKFSMCKENTGKAGVQDDFTKGTD